MKKLLLLSLFVLVITNTTFGQTGVGCWRIVSAGENFSLGIKFDGTLWGWGQNGNKLGLGLGNLADQNLPVQIGTANDWATVSAGNVHSLAVKINGTLWAWGNGQFGQLGNGVFNSATPNLTQVGTATDWLAVSAGNRFSLAIKTTGTLWSWGLNSVGQLGQGNITNLNLPTQVGSASNWTKIDAGSKHALAIDATGFVYGWGDNTFGQLGNGTNTSSLVPIMLSSSNNWAEVSAGLDHSLFLNTFGFLFSSGNNTNGQLCNGSNTASNMIMPATNSGAQFQYIAISAGGGHSLVIDNMNNLYSSGLNSQGQLGLGNNTNSNVLVQVGTSNNWFAISAGDTHSLALETSTALWSTGRGIEGELGIGTNVANNTLQSVNCPSTPLSIETSTKNKTSIVVYPNPTSDFIKIKYNLENQSVLNIKLTNILGQDILELKSEANSNSQQDIIDIRSQANGIYFLSISNKEVNYTVKIIKN